MAEAKGPGSDNGGAIPIRRFVSRRHLRRIVVAVLLVALYFFVTFSEKSEITSIEDAIQRYLSHNTEEQTRLEENRLKTLAEGLRQCASIKERPISQFDSSRANPRAVKSAPPVVINNASIIDGDGAMRRGLSILLDQGLIAEISDNMDTPEKAKVIDVGGRYVSPGLVDMVCILRSVS